MTISEIRRLNLRALIKEHGSAAALCQRVPRLANSYISQILHATPNQSGRPRSMGDDVARRIEESLGLPDGWMDQLHSADSSTQPARIYEAPAVYATTATLRLFPLISWVQAGHWTDIPDQHHYNDAEEWLPCAARCGPRTFVLRVQGESMAPRFADGELIFVDPDAEARHGSFVVVRLDDAAQATFKQLIIEGGRRFLRAINERWPDPIIEINSHATLCGVVIFKGQAV